jgi:plasmid stabilization system protein ParE
LGNLRAIRTYIAQFNAKAAAELAVRLIGARNSLEHFPHRGRPVRELVTVSPSHHPPSHRRPTNP